ncbi:MULTISPECIES: 3-methyl-2-oxobutanoate hydroxymethyltransferase [unclassified Pantoea]|uniref:3-methyl-2-oxobutanoate hydroxymethyltransferase n=1 Tax=unclassified Pantoea TaxID=2630326 RepID=UPI002A5A33F3|nr:MULTISPECIES: 3-methyl-2-oxobutanoate hydroxymethyltransferase [unclassified Pantoea]
MVRNKLRHYLIPWGSGYSNGLGRSCTFFTRLILKRNIFCPSDWNRCRRRYRGQVLVLHDMLGLNISGRRAKFFRKFMANQPSIPEAIKNYVREVKDGSTPPPEKCYIE